MSDKTDLTPEELRKATVKAYRHLGFLLDTHPDIPAPSSIWDFSDEKKFVISLGSYSDPAGRERVRERMADVARALRKSYFRVEKDMSGSIFKLTVPLGDVWVLEISCNKEEVCERRVVGTRLERKPVYEEVLVRHEHQTVEDVEWDCSEPLLAGSS